MVENIPKHEAFEILSIKNKRGNTPLHLAAELGDILVCCCIATKDLRLLSVQNHDGATPLFISVLNGKKDAFFHLDYLVRESTRESGSEIDYSLYKRKNGYTILHAAVFRGYFGLAIQIIKLHSSLVNSSDDFGRSALHILARKYAAFESGSFLTRIDSIILQRLNVEHLVEKEQNRSWIYLDLVRSNGKRSADLLDIFVNKDNMPVSNCKGNGKTLMEKLCGSLREIAKVGSKLFLGLSGIDIHYLIQHGREKRKSLIKKKTRWTLASILLEELVNRSSMYVNDPKFDLQNDDEELSSDQLNELSLKKEKRRKLDTPFIIAARHGVNEVVEAILTKYPMAAFDLDSKLKNAAIIVAENKWLDLYDILHYKYEKAMKQMMKHIDIKGNSVLHHSAAFRDVKVLYSPEPISSLRGQYLWYQDVKDDVPPEFVSLQNMNGLTADDVFMSTHGKLIKHGSELLSKTSESCSVVAALIATVAFATSAVDAPSSDSNIPLFLGVPFFDFYCLFGLLALCFSLVSLLYFLALRVSSFRVIDFGENLPMKLFLGLMFLLLSMVCILASFCFRHYSLLENDTMKLIVIPIYILTSIRVLTLAAYQLPFYHGTSFQSKFRAPI
ncbi:hypothetical protein M5689_014579 [Euphorbia peplus]|nr:hypothetical protein M5689_014579 [Euphorbia peplus]